MTKRLYLSFEKSAKKSSGRPAIVWQTNKGYQTYSYAQLHDRVRRFSGLFKEKGVQPGDKVIIILDNRPEYAASFFGLMSLEATAVPLDLQFSPAQVAHILRHSDAKFIITNEKIYRGLQSNLSEAVFIVVDSKKVREKLEHCSGGIEEGLVAPDVGVEDSQQLAVLFYTSGTTNQPKAVMLTESNLLSNVQSIKDLNLIRPQDKLIAFLPLHHAYAFTVTLLAPIFLGACIVYPEGLSSNILLSCLRDQQVTLFVGVPQVFALLYRSIRDKMAGLSPMKKKTVSFLEALSGVWLRFSSRSIGHLFFQEMHQAFGGSLRFMVSGGAKLDPEITKAFSVWGFTILEGYGLTETSPVVSMSPLEKPKIGSVGRPLAGVQVKINAPDARGQGEVIIQGANVMAGYYKMERATQDVLRDGWFYSGDMGYLDKEGYLYLTGRKKEMIVLSSGKNIYPDEIERHYEQSSLIKEMCVFPMKMTGLLSGVEKLGALIVMNDEYIRGREAKKLNDKLKGELDNLSQKLPTYRRISGFMISPDPLPRTALGKLKRYKIEQLYQDSLNNLSPSSPSDGAEEGASMASDAVQKALSFLEEKVGKKVSLDDHLELDLGMDSLCRVEILLGLQNYLNLEMAEDEAMDFFMSGTVRELVDKMQRHFPEGQGSGIESGGELKWEDILKEPPQGDVLTYVQTEDSFLKKMGTVCLIFFFKIIFHVFFLLRVEGRENVRAQKGPFLICPNHTSFLDGLIVLSALPLKTALTTHFAGFSIIFENFILNQLVRMGRIISIDSSYNLIEALRACAYVLRQKKIMCYFPEGERSVDGKLKPFKKGVGILVKELNVPVVPVYIEGAYAAWPRHKKFPRLGRLRIRFGSARSAEDLCSGNDDGEKAYTQIAEGLANTVSSLKRSDHAGHSRRKG